MAKENKKDCAEFTEPLNINITPGQRKKLLNKSVHNKTHNKEPKTIAGIIRQAVDEMKVTG